MKTELFNNLMKGEVLGYKPTKDLFDNYVLCRNPNKSFVVAVLTAYCIRRPQASELTAVVESVRDNALDLDELKKLHEEVPLPYNILIDAYSQIVNRYTSIRSDK